MSKIAKTLTNFFYFDKFLYQACTVRGFSNDFKIGNYKFGDSVLPTKPARLQPKVVIIGAGLAGLSAANHLIQNNFTNVVVLEASDRAGGRIFSIPFADAICELGAKRINFSQDSNSVYAFVRKEGLNDLESVTNEAHYMTSKGEALNFDITHTASLVFSSLISSVETSAKNNKSLNCRAYLLAEIEDLSKKMFKKQSTTAHKVFRSLFRDLANFVGCDLSDVNPIHLSQIAKSYSNPSWLSSGLGEVTNTLATSLHDDQLIFGKPVGLIRWSELQSSQSAYVGCLDGSTFTADHIICTFPLGSLRAFNQFFFVPQLPKRKIESIKRLGVGSSGKIFLKYTNSTVSWFVGTLKPIWSSIELNDKNDWSRAISEISTVPHSKHILEVTIGGVENEDFERSNDAIVIEKLTQFFKKFIRNKNIPYPKEIVRSFWSTDSRFLGGQSYLSMQSDQNNVHEFSFPLVNVAVSSAPVVMFAGEATIVNGFGTLDGARQSGIREAQRIVDYHIHKLDYDDVE